MSNTWEKWLKEEKICFYSVSGVSVHHGREDAVEQGSSCHAGQEGGREGEVEWTFSFLF
jgi:hypothetical protein